MTQHPRYKEVAQPVFSRPTLVIGVEGWVDAGLGAGGAIANLIEQTSAEPFIVFDADHYLDMRARRPIARIVDGVNTGLTWPNTELRHGTDFAGNDVLILSGPEPDFNWSDFTADLIVLAKRFGVTMAVGLGAFPAPAPHTRPVRLAATAPPESSSLLSEIGVVGGEIEVPAGVQSAIELAFGEEGITTISLWARVPHYVAGSLFPAAGVALLDGLERISGLDLDLQTLRNAAEGARDQIDELISKNPEHRAMVHRLEEAVDESEGNPFGVDGLPSADELADELERFLREEDQG